MPALRKEAGEQARRQRLRRAIVALAGVDLLIVLAIVALIAGIGGEPTPSSAARLPGFVTGSARRRLAPLFDRAARESHLAAPLLMGLAWQESEWEQGLVSNAGAVGVGQLLPGNAAFVARSLLHQPRLDPYRAADNIRLTARYLRSLIDELGGNERLGVGAYLQGSTSVRAEGLTPQTAVYVSQVEGLRAAFERARRAH